MKPRSKAFTKSRRKSVLRTGRQAASSAPLSTAVAATSVIRTDAKYTITSCPTNEFGLSARVVTFDGGLLDLATAKPHVNGMPNFTRVNIIRHERLLELLRTEQSYQEISKAAQNASQPRSTFGTPHQPARQHAVGQAPVAGPVVHC